MKFKELLSVINDYQYIIICDQSGHPLDSETCFPKLDPRLKRYEELDVASINPCLLSEYHQRYALQIFLDFSLTRTEYHFMCGTGRDWRRVYSHGNDYYIKRNGSYIKVTHRKSEFVNIHIRKF